MRFIRWLKCLNDSNKDGNMAKLKTETREIDVTDGEKILSACEQIGIPFGCKDGSCGTCLIKVISGMENLSEPADAERAEIPLADDQRLACQCRIKKGVVWIRSEWKF